MASPYRWLRGPRSGHLHGEVSPTPTALPLPGPRQPGGLPRGHRQPRQAAGSMPNKTLVCFSGPRGGAGGSGQRLLCRAFAARGCVPRGRRVDSRFPFRGQSPGLPNVPGQSPGLQDKGSRWAVSQAPPRAPVPAPFPLPPRGNQSGACWGGAVRRLGECKCSTSAASPFPCPRMCNTIRPEAKAKRVSLLGGSVEEMSTLVQGGACFRTSFVRVGRPVGAPCREAGPGLAATDF